MVFDSIAALIAMEGHGAYVWSCYGVSALVLAWLVVEPGRRRRASERRIRLRLRRDVARKSRGVE